jgi:hypothetical protein
MKLMKLHPALSKVLSLWPLLYLVAIFLIAPLFAVATPIPLLSVIGLLYISATMSKNRVIIWAIIYTLAIGCMYFDIRIWNYVHSSYLDSIKQYSFSENLFRFVTFLIISVFGCVFTLTNDKLKSLKSFHQHILNSLDEAVITADIDGRINYLNDSAKKLLGKNRIINEQDFIDLNFIEIFFDSKHRGKMLSKYIQSFEIPNPDLELQLQGCVLHSKMKKIKKFKEDLMMIIIRN